jgi:hypothetical protein
MARIGLLYDRYDCVPCNDIVIFDPGGNDLDQIAPRAIRAAAMTKVRLLTGTPCTKAPGSS